MISPRMPRPDRPLLAAIHSEAMRLSDLVSDMAGPSRGLVRRPGHFEAIAVADLLSMSLRRFKADGGEGGTAMEVAELEPGLASLRVEVSALSAALAHLVQAVSERRNSGGRMWVRPSRRGGVLQIEVGALSSAAAMDLEATLDAAIAVGREWGFTVRHTVQRHAGEVWAFTDGGCAGFRLTLPLDEDRPAPPEAGEGLMRATRFVGAGTVSGAGGSPLTHERIDLYDFSLFDQMERHVLPSDRECRLDELTFVVLDSETTGLRPEEGDRIVSLAGVKVRGGAVKRSETFDALVKPGRAVPAESSRFHGLTDEMLADAPPIDVVLPAFERFATGAVLVGHEISFDLRFLSRAADRIGLAASDRRSSDPRRPAALAGRAPSGIGPYAGSHRGSAGGGDPGPALRARRRPGDGGDLRPALALAGQARDRDPRPGAGRGAIGAGTLGGAPGSNVSGLGAKLLVLFVLAALVLNFPVLAIWNRGVTLGGIPILYLYLFAVWAARDRRGGRADAPAPGRRGVRAPC